MSYYGDFESAEEEARQREIWENSHDPEVVPCPQCGEPMYEVQDICDACEIEELKRAKEEEL